MSLTNFPIKSDCTARFKKDFCTCFGLVRSSVFATSGLMLQEEATTAAPTGLILGLGVGLAVIGIGIFGFNFLRGYLNRSASSNQSSSSHQSSSSNQSSSSHQSSSSN